MKNKQKSLQVIDLVTELTISELEGVNGGASELGVPLKPTPQGQSTPNQIVPLPDPPPPEEVLWNQASPKHQSHLTL